MQTTLKELASKESLLKSARLFIDYLRNPIQGIQTIPQWDWLHLLFHILAFTALTGVISGIVQTSVLGLLHGLVIIPIITLILTVVGSLFFYFFFQVFAERTFSLRRIMTIIFFANIPFFIFQTVAEYFPPISLIGLAFTGFILVTGFTVQFGLDRRFVIRIVSLVYAMFFIVWLWSRFDALRSEREFNETLRAPPVKLGE